MYARITRWTVGVLAIAALVCTGAALAAGGPAAKRPPSGGPPGNVWTCDYIAAHPAEAAAALVSCDGSVPAGATSTASSPLAPTTLDTADVAPCKYVPLGGGYVSPGVYAWSDLDYMNLYSYAPQTIQWFHYWVQKTDGTTIQQGDDNVANEHYTPGGYNYLYWGARNDGYTVQRWNYCWHTP
jgi:hypothetical protein